MAQIEDPRLQTKKIRDIAPLRRQRLNKFITDCVSDRCIRRVEGRLGLDSNRGFALSHVHRQIDCGGLIDEKLHLYCLDGETGRIRGEFVGAWIKLLEDVSSRRVALHRDREAGIRSSQSQGGSRYQGAA